MICRHKVHMSDYSADLFLLEMYKYNVMPTNYWTCIKSIQQIQLQPIILQLKTLVIIK